MHIHAQPSAPIACDMRGAPDTPDERIAAYHRLFASALQERSRERDAVVFRFRSGVRETVEELARREAACCPFLDYRVEAADASVVFTIGGAGREDAATTLDAFYALSEVTRT
jgi:hypothetical protein